MKKMRLFPHEVVKELRKTNSRLDKVAILEYQKSIGNDEVLKEVLVQALSPFIQFYIRQIPEYTPSPTPHLNTNSMIDQKFLDVLSNRVKTGNEAKEYLADLLSWCEAGHDEMLKLIIGKDLKAGVDVKTVNRVWPGLIPEFPVMLCESYSVDKLKKINFPATIQEKCDGMRVNFLTIDGKVHVRGRSGKNIELLDSLDNEILAISNGQNVVIDGELLVLNKKGDAVLPRKRGNGILNKAIRGTISNEEADRVVAVCWDIIPYSSWQSISKVGGQYETAYLSRFTYLNSRIVDSNSSRISTPETENVNTLEEARAFYLNMLKDGKEGAVLKNNNSFWQGKRSKEQVKLKIANEVDLEIVEREQGTGKNAGKLGAFVCRSSDGLLVTSVGTGFSDKERMEYFADDGIVGRIITVKANDIITSDDKSTKSLFLPVFIEMREDKLVADSFSKICEEFDNIYGR